jgi:isopentenyldiphosphate isomerase
MNTAEYFDVLDCRGLKTGETISRDEAHRTGAWHGAFHALIIYEREGEGYALFQRRSRAKKIAPGKCDVSVGGHYSAGENALGAGPREIGEELGLEVTFDELVPVGRRVFVYGFTPGVREQEFQDVFLLPRLVRPEDLALQSAEVDGLVEIEIHSGINLFSREIAGAECRSFGNGITARRDVFVEEFVPCLDNYYLKLFLLAERYFNGERNRLVI